MLFDSFHPFLLFVFARFCFSCISRSFLSLRWADDIRTQDKAQNRLPWHYVNLPFKPEGQPDSVQVREPEPVNILTALAKNESVVKNETDGERRVIAPTVRHKPDRMSYGIW
jgi:hypothetical protein